MDIAKLNLLGAYVAIVILLTSSLIFIFRLNNNSTAEYWTGLLFILMIFPLIFLIHKSIHLERSKLYYIQLGLMIGFILLELLLDYIFKVNFRASKLLLIFYVTMFFAGTGGMIGVASLAGKQWAVISIILFLIMTSLAFYQRFKTGM